MRLALDLNRWQRRVAEPRTLAIVSILLLVTGAVSVAVRFSPAVRRFVVKPEATPDDIRPTFR